MKPFFLRGGTVGGGIKMLGFSMAMLPQDSMRHLDVTPNVFSYNATISACEGSRGSHWEQALNLFGTMLKRQVEADRILVLFTLGDFFFKRIVYHGIYHHEFHHHLGEYTLEN